MDGDGRLQIKVGEDNNSPEPLDIGDIILDEQKIAMTPNFKFGDLPSDKLEIRKLRPDRINVSSFGENAKGPEAACVTKANPKLEARKLPFKFTNPSKDEIEYRNNRIAIWVIFLLYLMVVAVLAWFFLFHRPS